MLKTRSGRRASQNEHELRSFIDLLKDRGAKSYLEIGARHGDTFYEVMTSLPIGSFGLAMDLPGGLWGNPKSVNSLQEAVQELRSMGYDIELVIGDSKSEKCIRAANTFAPFDAVLIDGDHLYEGVKSDWLNYGHLGNVVAFHDIVGNGQVELVHRNPVEVPMFWAELKSNHNYVEYIEDNSTMGIGVVIR